MQNFKTFLIFFSLVTMTLQWKKYFNCCSFHYASQLCALVWHECFFFFIKRTRKKCTHLLVFSVSVTSLKFFFYWKISFFEAGDIPQQTSCIPIKSFCKISSYKMLVFQWSSSLWSQRNFHRKEHTWQIKISWPPTAGGWCCQHTAKDSPEPPTG